jgi:ubiquinone biosynthesis monooxygenase Coq7
MAVDDLICGIDKALRTLFVAASTLRSVPGAGEAEADLSLEEKASAGALMRVNHVGEICAQALYQGQVLTCRDQEIRAALEKAAVEETEHLAWTERRILELGARKSILNPLWYLGALSIGVVVGRVGDGWSLGFLAETERQVEAHLDSHLDKLPKQDVRSRTIVAQMKSDEQRHAETAVALGAKELPAPARQAMRLAARVMTRTAYYL